MQTKLRTLLVAVCATGFVSATAFAVDNNNAQTETMKPKVSQPKRKATKEEKASTTQALSKTKKVQLSKLTGGSPLIDNYVVIAPYTGQPTYNTGTSLVVNAPSINEDAKLLTRRMLEERALLDAGRGIPDHPRLVLSGKVEGQGIYTRPYTGARSSDIDLTGAELDTFIEMTQMANGFFAINYDNYASSTPRRQSNSNVRLDKGFLTIGNFRQSPFYGSIGQMATPFGRYASSMITDPLTKTIARVKARVINLGYDSQADIGPEAHLFMARGDSTYGGSNMAKQYGADLAFHILKPKYNADAGISYITNMADSEGMQNTYASSSVAFQGFDKSENETLVHRVAGANAHLNAGYGPFTAFAEYVTALQQFSSQNLTYNGHGAKQSAFNTEGAYAFTAFNKPMYFALGYGRTYQSLALNVPKQRYIATWAVTFFDNVVGKLEFSHNINYGKSDTATGQTLTAYDPKQLGRTQDVVKAEIGVYF